jgi:hypothetical protein
MEGSTTCWKVTHDPTMGSSLPGAGDPSAAAAVVGRLSGAASDAVMGSIFHHAPFLRQVEVQLHTLLLPRPINSSHRIPVYSKYQLCILRAGCKKELGTYRFLSTLLLKKDPSSKRP